MTQAGINGTSYEVAGTHKSTGLEAGHTQRSSSAEKAAYEAETAEAVLAGGEATQGPQEWPEWEGWTGADTTGGAQESDTAPVRPMAAHCGLDSM